MFLLVNKSRLSNISNLLIIFLFSFLNCSCFSTEKQTVCLNMIVKNEKRCIQRCLESAKPLIDSYVIVDTGSTDGTQELVKQTLQGIPGELYERSWKNFEHNRNEALALASGKGDYVLFIDADEVFVYEKGYRFPKLTKDVYCFPVQELDSNNNESSWGRKSLLKKNDNGLFWKGVIHAGNLHEEF